MEPQNVGLTPTPEEVQEAQRRLAYFAQLDEQGEVEGELDGRVVDKYAAARAAELLEWSALCAQKRRAQSQGAGTQSAGSPGACTGVRLARATER